MPHFTTVRDPACLGAISDSCNNLNKIQGKLCIKKTIYIFYFYFALMGCIMLGVLVCNSLSHSSPHRGEKNKNLYLRPCWPMAFRPSFPAKATPNDWQASQPASSADTRSAKAPRSGEGGEKLQLPRCSGARTLAPANGSASFSRRCLCVELCVREEREEAEGAGTSRVETGTPRTSGAPAPPSFPPDSVPPPFPCPRRLSRGPAAPRPPGTAPGGEAAGGKRRGPRPEEREACRN